MIEKESIKFTDQQIKILQKYLYEDWLKELNRIINMYDESADIDTQIEHIRKYIIIFCNSNNDDIKDTIYNFFDLLEHYKSKKYREPIRDEQGLIILTKSGFNSCNGYYTGKIKSVKTGLGSGEYIEGRFISTDRKEYIKKFSMDARGKMSEYNHHIQSRYNGVIAHEIFKYFEIQSASYLPAITKFPYYYVITENFLNDNQELITFDDCYINTTNEEDIASVQLRELHHSDIIRILKENITMRYKRNMTDISFSSLIGKLKLQYAEQEFIKRLIGLKDEKLGNIAIIKTSNGNELEVPEIDISPAFDLDVSFNFGAETKMAQTRTDNGKVDIKSLIEEFSNINGFKSFIDSIFYKIQDEDQVIELILNNSYETSHAVFFLDEDNRRDYITFLKQKFRDTKEAYYDIFLKSKDYNNKGEDKDARTILD